MPERVVKSIVERLRRDPQPAGGVAVDHKLGLQTFVLLVRILVSQLRQFFSFCNRRGAHVFNSSRCCALQRVLILRVAIPSPDREFLR